MGDVVPINVQSDKTRVKSASRGSATDPAVGLRQNNDLVTLSNYNFNIQSGVRWNRKSASNLGGVALLTA